MQTGDASAGKPLEPSRAREYPHTHYGKGPPMKHLPLIVGLFWAWGCAAPPVPGHPLYTPGEKLLMVVGLKVIDRTIGTSSEYLGDRLVKSTETPTCSRIQRELEMEVDVAPSATPGRADLTIRTRRDKSTHSYKGGGEESTGSTDSANPQAATQPGEKDTLETMVQGLKTVFSAVVEPNGKVVDFDARGPAVESARERLAKKALTSEERMLSLMLACQGPGGALLEASAYLPSADARVGQQWGVTREKVPPSAGYYFCMFTNGAWYCSERSTCTVEAVTSGPAGRIVTVGISGRRVPGPPSPSMPRRVDYLTTTGRVKFNLDTGAIPELRIETRPHFMGAEDRRLIDLTFIDTIRLEKR